MSQRGCPTCPLPRRPMSSSRCTPSGIAEAARGAGGSARRRPRIRPPLPRARPAGAELRAMYRMTLSDSVQHGHAFVTRLDGGGDRRDRALPAGHLPDDPRAAGGARRFRIAADRRHTREHSLGIIKFGDVTSAGVPGDSWYVEALGVRPDLQRAGRGKRLMATVFGLIDARRRPVLPGDHQARQRRRTTPPSGTTPCGRACRSGDPDDGSVDLPDAPRACQRHRLASGCMENVDYTSTFIAVAPDSAAVAGVGAPRRRPPSRRRRSR